MQDNTGNGTRIGGWLAAFFALPVLYTLAIGPLAFLSVGGYLAPWADEALENSYKPLFTVSDTTSLKEPLETYIMWWVRLNGSRSGGCCGR